MDSGPVNHCRLKKKICSGLKFKKLLLYFTTVLKQQQDEHHSLLDKDDKCLDSHVQIAKVWIIGFFFIMRTNETVLYLVRQLGLLRSQLSTLTSSLGCQLEVCRMTF